MALNAETKMWLWTPNEIKYGSERRTESVALNAETKMWLLTSNETKCGYERWTEGVALNAELKTSNGSDA